MNNEPMGATTGPSTSASPENNQNVSHNKSKSLRLFGNIHRITHHFHHSRKVQTSTSIVQQSQTTRGKAIRRPVIEIHGSSTSSSSSSSSSSTSSSTSNDSSTKKYKVDKKGYHHRKIRRKQRGGGKHHRESNVSKSNFYRNRHRLKSSIRRHKWITTNRVSTVDEEWTKEARVQVNSAVLSSDTFLFLCDINLHRWIVWLVNHAGLLPRVYMPSYEHFSFGSVHDVSKLVQQYEEPWGEFD